MLDAYIIDRIRRERDRERQKDARVPLHIDQRPSTHDDRRDDEQEPSERGSVIIDYSA